MREIQKCQKCGKTFSEVYRTGPSIGRIGEIMRHADENICHLSAYKRMKEVNRHLRLGCFWAIVAIIG